MVVFITVGVFDSFDSWRNRDHPSRGNMDGITPMVNVETAVLDTGRGDCGL
jgi:hypothetical protein